MNEENEALKFMFKAVLVGGAAIAVLVTGYYVFLPRWNDMETKGTEHSYVFVQSKKELLLKLNSDYKKLEVQRLAAQQANDSVMVLAYQSQQIAIVDRMKLEAASLPPNEIPVEVSILLK